MASSFEKSVKGGTKIKLAAPKSKYVEHILIATHTGEAGVAEIFRALQNRLRDSTWTIVFKGLIIVHLMIREGEKDVTLRYVAANPRKLAISNFSEVQEQGRNIRNYTQYLLERAHAYRDTKVDFVRSGEGRLKKLPVEKGLLRETEAVQLQITALVKCDVLMDEPENEITLTAFRLLVMDLLALFHVMNEGVINILEHFFEMSKYDAERALAIYKTFSKQTNETVEYLQTARHYEHATRLEVPRLKHAPTGLTGALEEYTKDPDFEINRRQFLAQLEAKRNPGKPNGSSKPPTTNQSKPMPARPGAKDDFPAPKAAPAAPAKQEAKGPDPDLIDFFESIEQNQQPMAQSLGPPQTQQPYPYQTQQSLSGNLQAFAPQQNLFGPAQPDLSHPQPASLFDPQQNQMPAQAPLATGYGGFISSQPAQSAVTTLAPSLPSIAQQSPFVMQTTGFSSPQPGNQPQAQSSNPFRQSMMPSQNTGISSPQGPFSGGSSSVTSPLTRQSTNPFSKPLPAQPVESMTFGSQSPTSLDAAGAGFPGSANHAFQPSMMPDLSSQQTHPKSTNPFSQAVSPQPLAPPPQQQHQPGPLLQPAVNALAPQPTGASTNPFRQSMMPTGGTMSSTSPWASQAGPAASQQGTIGGLEHLPTVPVFPRPGETR